MHDSRAERSRNPTVLTRSSSPSSAKQTFARAFGSLATVTTRKTAARDRGASMLCASIGTLSQFLFDIRMLHAFQNHKRYACERPPLSGSGGMLVQSF